MSKDITIYAITISLMALIVGICVAITINAWGANKETSIENTKLNDVNVKLNDKILGLEKGLGFCNEDLKECQGESQMHQFNFEMCQAQEYLYNYFYEK